MVGVPPLVPPPDPSNQGTPLQLHGWRATSCSPTRSQQSGHSSSAAWLACHLLFPHQIPAIRALLFSCMVGVPPLVPPPDPSNQGTPLQLHGWRATSCSP